MSFGLSEDMVTAGDSTAFVPVANSHLPSADHEANTAAVKLLLGASSSAAYQVRSLIFVIWLSRPGFKP